MQGIVYLIDTYFFDHMHPLSPKMTTKNHFIIGTILKSITIYHSFSTYWCLYLDKNIRVINPWFQATNALVTNLVVLMSDAIKRIVNTTIFTILFIAFKIIIYICSSLISKLKQISKLDSHQISLHQILIHQTVMIQLLGCHQTIIDMGISKSNSHDYRQFFEGYQTVIVSRKSRKENINKRRGIELDFLIPLYS